MVTVTDLFCGAGGSSLGAHHAGGDIHLAINHWPLAIETHNSNFPNTMHDCANVSEGNPRRYPSTNVLIASPECTNHTGASGRKRVQAQMDLFKQQELDPSAERSRATMWDVPRFSEYHGYELVIVENVVEARKWPPFISWLQAMDSLGYDSKILYLNSMFFHPAPQSRDRMYVVFWKKGNPAPDLDYRPVAYCGKCECNVHAVQSWSNPNKAYGKWGRYKVQYVYRCPVCVEEVTPYYYCAANVIDWSLQGERIGDRKKPLQPKTMKRIRKGLELYGNQVLMIQVAYGHSHDRRSNPVIDAMPTQSTRQSMALLSPPFLVSTNYFKRNRSMEEVYPTQIGDPQHALVTNPFFIGYANGEGPPHPVTDALLTQFGSNAHALITPSPFLADIVHTPRNGRDQDMVYPMVNPIRTQLGNSVHTLVSPPFVVHLRNNMTGQSIDDPLSTVTAGGGHHALIDPAPFLASYYGSGGQLSGIDQAIATVTTLDKHSIVTPLPEVEDCRFRMLQPHEIGKAMAFPEDYEVRGTKREQVKQLGNAVTPPVMEWIFGQAIKTLS